MSLFGWSYPPGCSGTPYDEAGACDITKCVEEAGLPGCMGVFWDEDGVLWEAISYTVPADPYNGTPEYQETDSVRVGAHEWNDELSDDENFRAAARAYINLKGAKQ